MARDQLSDHRQEPMTAVRPTRMAHVPARLQIVIVVGLTLIYAVCYVTIKAGLAFAPPFVSSRAILYQRASANLYQP
jgi:hypothetical protein